MALILRLVFLLLAMSTAAAAARAQQVPNPGQQAMAGSVPVVVASDQSAVPVSGTLSTRTALTPAAPAAASVGVASAAAVAANASRKGLVVVNTSTNTISCTGASAAVLNSGITLYPGGAWTMNEYTYTTGAIDCIASAAASNLSVQEF